MESGTITSVQRQKRQNHRYNIFVNDVFVFSVHEDVLMKYRLFKGETISPEFMEDIIKDEEKQDAYVKTLRWLGTRQRTGKEIKMYLKRKEYDDEVIRVCIERLESQGYVNDERFSRDLAAERLQSHGKGKNWIKQELMHKGVHKSVIQETVSSIEEGEELRSAMVTAQKRWKVLSKQGDRLGAKRKLYAFLARRGFSASVVQQAVREATQGEEDEGEADELFWE